MSTHRNVVHRFLSTIGIVFLLFGCATTQRDWQAATSHGTVEAYEQFINKYPYADETEEARRRLASLKAEDAWRRAESIDTIDGYTEFLIKHLRSKQDEMAVKRLKQLKIEKEWKTAKGENSVEMIEKFLKNHPSSEYSHEANKQLAALLAEQERIHLEQERILLSKIDNGFLVITEGESTGIDVVRDGKRVESYHVGMHEKKFVQQFGSDNRTIPGNPDYGWIRYSYKYYDRGLEVAVRNGRIIRFELYFRPGKYNPFKPAVAYTDTGLTVGASYDDIIRCYGYPTRRFVSNSMKWPPTRAYEYSFGLFVLYDDKLKGITVGESELSR
ncbi:MAG: hypothetical protein KKH97_08125 [Proteobacteria bacterium]|nr:hypothetical protein [Pseudomonadota bacterium]